MVPWTWMDSTQWASGGREGWDRLSIRFQDPAWLKSWGKVINRYHVNYTCRSKGISRRCRAEAWERSRSESRFRIVRRGYSSDRWESEPSFSKVFDTSGAKCEDETWWEYYYVAGESEDQPTRRRKCFRVSEYWVIHECKSVGVSSEMPMPRYIKLCRRGRNWMSYP